MNTHKPYPWKCSQCGHRAVVPTVAPYALDMEHDGRSYSVTIEELRAPRCGRCGEIVLDDCANRQISEAFRKQLGLLTPEQIRQHRGQLGKTQRELATALGVAEATLSRWETGAQIQQRAMDRLLRLYFALASVRAALADEESVRSLATFGPNASESHVAQSTAELSETVLADFQAAIHSLHSRIQDEWSGQVVDCLRASEREIAQSLWPVFKWYFAADRNTLRALRSCVEQQSASAASAKPGSVGKSRWLVCPLQSESEADLQRAARIAQLAQALEGMPEEKFDAALVLFEHSSLSR